MSSLKEKYEQYIQSEHWKNLRGEAIHIAGRKCEVCQSRSDLQGHHLQYRNFTDCTADDVLILCDGCHKLWHAFFASHVIKSRDFTIGFIYGAGSSINGLSDILERSAQADGITLARPPEPRPTAYRQKKAQGRAQMRLEVENDPRVVEAARKLNKQKFKQFIKNLYASRSKKSVLCGYAHAVFGRIKFQMELESMNSKPKITPMSESQTIQQQMMADPVILNLLNASDTYKVFHRKMCAHLKGNPNHNEYQRYMRGLWSTFRIVPMQEAF